MTGIVVPALDAPTAAHLVAVLYGLSAALTFAEKFAISGEFAADGWFSWRIMQFDRRQQRVYRWLEPVLAPVFGQAGMAAVMAVGVAGVFFMVLFQPGSIGFTAGVLATVLASLTGQVRSMYGGDGSQQMNLVIGVALLLGFNPWVAPAVGTVGLVFIAAESCFAYFTSGASKLVSPVWMHGDPLVGIMSTSAYGSGLGLRLVVALSHARRWLALTMVGFEVVFPVVLVGPEWLLFGLLAVGIAFHLSNAVFMGLNTFLWSFVATYPAIVFVWGLIH